MSARSSKTEEDAASVPTENDTEPAKPQVQIG